MKNKISLFLLPTMAALWLGSCHKDPNKTVIQGHITEYGTNAPIEGARIYLWCYNGEIFGPTGTSFIDSIVTDAQGAFHTEYLDRDLCGGIYLSAFKEGFFYKSDIDIHSGVNDLEVVLDPEAWLNVTTIPDGSEPYLSVGGTFSFEAWSSEGTRERVFSARGNRNIKINWGWIPTQITEDTVFCVGHDTTFYAIHY